MAKRTFRAVIVSLAAISLANLITACAVKVPASDFPAMRLVQPDNSEVERLK